MTIECLKTDWSLCPFHRIVLWMSLESHHGMHGYNRKPFGFNLIQGNRESWLTLAKHTLQTATSLFKTSACKAEGKSFLCSNIFNIGTSRSQVGEEQCLFKDMSAHCRVGDNTPSETIRILRYKALKFSGYFVFVCLVNCPLETKMQNNYGKVFVNVSKFVVFLHKWIDELKEVGKYKDKSAIQTIYSVRADSSRTAEWTVGYRAGEEGTNCQLPQTQILNAYTITNTYLSSDFQIQRRVLF